MYSRHRGLPSPSYVQSPTRKRGLDCILAYASGSALVTIAVSCLWAHDPHDALPTRGVNVDRVKGRVALTAEARAALGLQTATATIQEVDERLLSQAVVQAPWSHRAFATSKLGGKILAVHVQAGQRVERGQKLAEVQSLELEDLLLALANARNEIGFADENLAQLTAASERGAVPEHTLLEARAERQEHANALDLARRKLSALGVDPDSANLTSLPALEVRSPMSGTLTHTDIMVGRVVEPMATLFEIVDLSAVTVRLEILERDLQRVQAGQAFDLRLAADPNAVFTGTVQALGRSLDERTHQGGAWAELSNSQMRLLPGMFGQAQIRLPSGQKLAVPARAMVRRGPDCFVFVEESPGEYVKRDVVVGRQTPTLVEIVNGKVIAGQNVVTVGCQQLATLFPLPVLYVSPEAAENIHLRVESPQFRPIAEIEQINGIVDLPPNRRGLASARLAGTIHRLHVDRDQMVRAGDMIAEVASLELQNLQLELLRSHLHLGVLQQTLDRLAPLAQSTSAAVPRRQLREAQSERNLALQKRDSYQRRLLAIGLTGQQVRDVLEHGRLLEALPIRAPIDGTVVRFHATLGQFIKAEDSLFEIHDLEHAAIRGYVSEQQFSSLRIGQRARIRLTAVPGVVMDATVARSSQSFGADDRTLSVWADLNERPTQQLQQGMLARLTLLGKESPPVLSLPRDAILRDGSRNFVFVRTDKGLFERRYVELGRSDDLCVEVVRGLEADDKVAVRGVADLQTAYAAIK